jgi:hypothetical protein
MAYFTKSDARAAAKRVVRNGRMMDSVTGSMESQRYQTSFDVFLSHSINDYELVLGVKQLLEEQGLKVYVDWVVDQQLERQKVDKNTAQVLRSRMKQSTSLMYIATQNASSSKWMPWEVGFFDGYRADKVAILPILDNEGQQFEGQEYLGLYPVVTKYLQNGVINHYVEEKGIHWKTLAEFVRGASSWRSYP